MTPGIELSVYAVRCSQS